MSNININSLFCSKFENETNSILGRFDKISLKDMDLNKISLVILTNKTGDSFYHIQCFFCKEGESGKLEKIIDEFYFNIPKDGISTDGEDNQIEDSDTFIREISIEKLKENGEGRYVLLIFSKEIEASEYGTIKSYPLEDLDFSSQSALTVSID